jgi:hypothetical protein
MNTVTKPQESAVLMKAFNNACQILGVTSAEKSQLLGVDRSTLSRKAVSGYSPDSKVGEIQLQFIRIYRSLYALGGGDTKFMRHWFSSNNNALNGVPAELCKRIDGIVRLNLYLDAMRGKI